MAGRALITVTPVYKMTMHTGRSKKRQGYQPFGVAVEIARIFSLVDAQSSFA